MSKELLIRQGTEGTDIALLVDGKLSEFHKESKNQKFVTGDVYLAQVRKIMPAHNAAFLSIDFTKDAFLQYFDLGPNIKSVKRFTGIARNGGWKSTGLSKFRLEPKTEKGGVITEELKKGEFLMVQVEKEPISSKGPKVTTDISFAGRYLVIQPFQNFVSVSKKIGHPNEKKRLKKLANEIKPQNFGLILRTAAENIDEADLKTDLDNLLKKWDLLVKKIHKAKAGTCIAGELNRADKMLRDLIDDKFEKIVVNTPALQTETKKYLKEIAPKLQNIVKLHTNKSDIFTAFGVEKQIKQTFGKKVMFGDGGYLIIEHTEALHVIDVNSGNVKGNNLSLPEVALKVNLAAADEIGRQLRLRDMGGIIVVDFIDLRSPAHKKQLSTAMKKAMAGDRAKHTILPITKFGLVQITRQRVRPAVEIATADKCYACNGSGKLETTANLEEQILTKLDHLWESLNLNKITLNAHPFVISHFKNGIISDRTKLFFKYKKWLKLNPNWNYGISSYTFTDEHGDDIKL